MLGTQIIIIIIIVIIIIIITINIIIIIIIIISAFYIGLKKLVIFACDCFLIEFVCNRVFENYYSA